jgi:hypothetical protein
MYDYSYMANLIDSIRQGISTQGANAIRTISNINPSVGGKIGKAVDVVGKKLNNPFPEAYASENAESQGGYQQMAQATTPEQRAQVEQKAQQRAGFSSAAAPSLPGNSGKVIGQYSVDPNNLDKLIDVGGGQMKTGRTILAETGGTGTYTSGGDKGGAPGFDFNEAVNKAGGNDLLSQYLNQGDIDSLLSKYSTGAYGRADDLAAEIERVASENAQREYNDVITALGGQKEEVGTLGKQQRERAVIEGDLTEQELLAKQESESKDIAKQRTGFIEEGEKERDKLGRAWKDMSLEVQRIMRGRGIADSSFATEKEVGVLKDFNAGLRELATKKSSALNDFADAAIETTQFYTRKRTQLAEEVRQKVEDVDNWVRQQVTTIQNQERTALSKKLADINNAILQGRQIKTDIANQVSQTELNFGMWLKQTEVNYKLAVAEAARGKVTSATDTIAKAAALSKNMFTLLENGQAQWVQNKDGTMGLQDALTGTAIPVRPGFKDEYEDLQASKQKTETLKQYTDNLVLNSLKGGTGNGTQDETQDGGLLSSITSFLKK